MQSRNQARGIPWAGAMALAIAIVTFGVVLSGPISLSSLLQTWYLSRAVGIIAFVLLWGSVTLGLLQSTGYLKGVTSPLANIDLHEFTSLGALYASIFHAVILLWDQYLPFRVLDLVVPFSGAYRPVLVGLGSVAFYVALGAVLTTYLRGRLNPKTWRQLHQISLLGFIAALVHGLLLGTDSGLPAVVFVYGFAVLSVALLVGLRIYRGFDRCKTSRSPY